MNKNEALEAAKSALLHYNDQIKSDDIAVRAFHLKWDDEFDNWVATTIFVLKDIERAEDMSFIDKYCSASGKALEGICVFTYCNFRSEDQYIEEFSNLSWVSELMDLQDAA